MEACVDFACFIAGKLAATHEMYVSAKHPKHQHQHQGGIAAVGQLQLLQPFFGLALAEGLLHEQVSLGMLLVTIAVIGCVAGAQRFAR